MSTPVVVVPSGGFPVTEALSPYGVPMTESPTGYGMPVTFTTGGFPVTGISAFIPGSPVNTVAPVISGTTTIGQVLSCTTGTWSPTATSYAYFWRRNGSLISGATASTYTLVAADNAAAMTCRVIGTNAIGPSLAIISNTLTLANVTPVNSVAPAITGTATVGSVLTVTNGTWSNSPSFTRQWRRGGVVIGGATATTYTLVAADNIAVIDCVVTATNAAAIPVTANSNSVTVAEARPVNSVVPVITGTATVGGTLSCTTGTWSNTPSAYAYQWLRNSVDISGATSSTYLLVSADLGASVTCLVIASNAIGAAPTPATSNAMMIGAAGTTTVTAPNGQWWKFSGTVENGVYVNGDVWVKTATTVSLIEVSTPTTGTGSTTVHGGMINPTFNTYAESSPMGDTITSPMKQGYDGRVGPYASSLTYDPALNAHLSLPRTLSPGDTLVSSISLLPETAPIPAPNPIMSARMACVTVVNYTPFADEFRPPYFGTIKTRRRFSEANLALLPSLTSSPFNPKGTWGGGFHIDLASVYAGAPSHAMRTGVDDVHINSFRDLQYWIMPYGIDQTIMRPLYNQLSYPRDFGFIAGQLSMYTMCNFSDRDFFVTRILQVAIDAYAIAVGGGYSGLAPFGAGAGFGYTPLWYIRFAGLLFNDTPMKNAASIATGKTDFYSGTIYKWGDLNNCYLSTSAHAQYRRVPGEVYTAGFPLYGDLPWTNVTGGVGDNGTTRDPAGVYDMTTYKYGLPTGSYPSILATTYEHWKVGGVEQTNMGSYSFMLSARQGQVMASIAMGDSAFWGGAVVAMAKRIANDPQWWTGWGTTHDYSDGFTAPKRPNRDVYAAGGTQSEWMLAMWETIVGVPAATAPTVSLLTPLDGATGVSGTANLTVQFSTAIQFGTSGSINIYRSSDDVLFETFDVVTHAGTKLTISGSTLTINPAGTLVASTGYYVQIAATAIKSTSYVAFAGIADKTTWNFTTAAGGVTYTAVYLNGTQYLSRSGGLIGLTDSKAFTFVIRHSTNDTGLYRTFYGDNAGNFSATIRPANALSGEAWGVGGLNVTWTSTTVTAENIDGMCTYFISARCTTGSQVVNVYQNGTNMIPAGVSFIDGNMDMTPATIVFLAGGGGVTPLVGAVEFIWFDNVYYDVSNSTVRDKWLAANINADGSGPGAQPKLFMYGPAATWNAGTNAGTGGTLTMTGTVS